MRPQHFLKSKIILKRKGLKNKKRKGEQERASESSDDGEVPVRGRRAGGRQGLGSEAAAVRVQGRLAPGPGEQEPGSAASWAAAGQALRPQLPPGAPAAESAARKSRDESVGRRVGAPAGLRRAPVSLAEAESPTARCVARSVREGGAGS